MPSILRSGRIACAILAMASSTLTFSATAGSRSARSLVTQKIDNNARVTLAHNVRPELNAQTDLGPVEDTMPIARMFLVLNRTPEQQAAMANLIERQHQATAPEFHKWLTPAVFGEKFGASQADIAKVTDWLTAQGFTVKTVLNNNSMIDFSGTSANVRETFRTQLHYLQVNGQRVYANDRDPQIPAALSGIIAGVTGLQDIPLHANHTKPTTATYDSASHTFHSNQAMAKPAYSDGEGDYLISPQDYYTIYNVNQVFTGGHKGGTAVIAVVEQSDMAYGTVNTTTHAATGGDVAKFRSLFGVPGTLNMLVYHGAGSDACTDPGVVNGDEGEATLDAEWANALAPAAQLIYMSCSNGDGGVIGSLAALVDNNLSDAMSLSYGETELAYSAGDYTQLDTLYGQAATQGQSVFVSTGDSGSDVADQNQGVGAVHGLNVSALSGSPYVTATGGTDFQDLYDSLNGGSSQSTYFSATNSSTYGDALGYVPEMSWNDNCASSIFAANDSLTPAAFCAEDPQASNGYDFLLNVVGGSGGFSTHYPAPSYQTGITGFSGSKRAQPDISMFASNGFWGHGLIFCDSDASDGAPCSSPSTFGVAGGTSFVAPAMAGIAGLLRDYTGTRQGVLNYGLYALAKTQFTASATKTACYSNGQTNNTGVTTGRPAAACIFNDVTTGTNDEGCTAGGTNCFVNSGASYGILSTTAPSTLTVGFPSTPGFDEVSGIGTLNVNNLLTKWNTAFSSTTKLTANPTTIGLTASTTLTATVTGGTPAGYTGKAPTLAGSINFLSGTTNVGSCTLSAGTCSKSVTGTTLGAGSHSITATFVGSNAYPTSTSTAVTVTVTGSAVNTTTTVTATPNPATQGASVALKATVTATAGTATGSITFTTGSTQLGSCTLSAGTCTASTTALPVGTDTVTASYSGATGFNASAGTVSVKVNSGTVTTTTKLTATPNPAAVGQSVSLKATVTASSGTATGKVNFSVGTLAIGSCTLSAGACTLTASSNGQAPGTYPVVATYAGATGYPGSKSPAVNVVLDKVGTTTTLTATPNPVTEGGNVTLKATVRRAIGAGVPTGKVNLSAFGSVFATVNLNGAGVATFTAPSTGVSPGMYPITATYLGDSSDTTSSGHVTETVN